MVRGDDVQQLERALSEGASVDSMGAVEAEDGFSPVYLTGVVTALVLAVGLGRNRIARLLLERGADVHAQDGGGTTAVYIGAEFGNVEMIVALAAAGGDVNAADDDGFTPVFIAAQEGHVETVRVLAELGACVKVPTNDGATPVHVAAQNGHTKVIRLLAVLKAELTATTVHGHTPLIYSAGNAHFEATKALLLLGVPITIEDLKQYSDAPGNTRQLRADLQAWAADALVQHRAFHGTFLTGCCARITPLDTTNPYLPQLAGKPGLLEKIGAFVGIVVGVELRHTRAMGPAIAVIDWAAHDEAR